MSCFGAQGLLSRGLEKPLGSRSPHGIGLYLTRALSPVSKQYKAVPALRGFPVGEEEVLPSGSQEKESKGYERFSGSGFQETFLSKVPSPRDECYNIGQWVELKFSRIRCWPTSQLLCLTVPLEAFTFWPGPHLLICLNHLCVPKSLSDVFI